MPDTPRYFLHNAGRLLGPYTLVQLRGMRDAKRLMPDTNVSTDGRTWQLALTVPGLFADSRASAARLDVLPVAPDALLVGMPPEPGEPTSNAGLFIGLGIGAGVVFLAVVALVLLAALAASRAPRESKRFDEDRIFNPSHPDPSRTPGAPSSKTRTK